MMKNFLKCLCVMSLTFFSLFPAFAENPDTISITIGEVEKIEVKNLNRVSVSDPTIADVLNAAATVIEVIGKKEGQTLLFYWDGDEKKTVLVKVAPIRNLQEISDHANKLLESAEISDYVKAVPNQKESKIIFTGQLPENKRPLLDVVIKSTETSANGAVVVNVVNAPEPLDMVQIDMMVEDVSSTAFKDLGVQWSSGGSGGINANYDEENTIRDDGIEDWFKFGQFNRTNQLRATFRALETQGKAKSLSRPKLVVLSGEKAHFNAGGEVPIVTTTLSSTGVSQNNVSYKEYGVTLDITPVIRGENIHMDLGIQSSDIDPSTNIPGTGVAAAFLTRTTQTSLVLQDKETILLSGLLRKKRDVQTDQIPVLGNVPILGLFFRHTTRGANGADVDSEMIITMTPQIIRGDRNAVKKDTEETREVIVKHYMSPQWAELKRQAAPAQFSYPGMDDYITHVIDQVTSNLSYPFDPTKTDWKGIVKVEALIFRDGSLGYAITKVSSGLAEFDKHAVEIVKKSAPFGPFPAGVDSQDIKVVIPVAYDLRK